MANGDLISREAAVQLLREKASGYKVSMFLTSGECNVARVVATECAADIKNLPAVDAEPVRNGRWYKPTGMMPPEHHGRHRCSVCGEMAFYERPGREGLSDYCPNCGAKMDGGTA